MSRWYTILKQQALGSQQASVEDALAKLAEKRPQEAARLRALDWSTLVPAVAHGALQEVARTLDGCALSEEFPTTGIAGGDAPRGRCVGALTYKEHTLGVFAEGAALSIGWAESTYAGSDTLADAQKTAATAREPEPIRQLRDALARAYQKHVFLAIGRILGRTSEVRTLAGGVEMITIDVKGGA